MGGGGAPANTSSINKNFTGPPPEYIPYFQSLYANAQNAAQNVPRTPYGGDFVAQPNAYQREAVSAEGALASNPNFQNLGANVLNLGQKEASGAYLDPNSNPYLPGLISSAIRPIEMNYQNTVLPGIKAGFSDAGAYGGDRMAIAEALAGQGENLNVANTVSNILGQNYATERGYMQNAPALINAGVSLDQTPANLAATAGDWQNTLDQLVIQNALQKYNNTITAPFNGLFPEASILSGLPFSTATQTAANYGSGLGKIGGTVAGTLGGATLGGVLGSQTGLGTGYGALLGGGLGALGGYFTG